MKKFIIKNYIFTTFVILFTSLVLIGCDSEEPDPGPGEEELITTVTVTLTPQAGGQAVSFVANDPDGDGANFTLDDITLAANTTYTGTITLRDDINGEDITEEIEEEDDEHQFWYTPGGDAAGRITVTITDMDGNSLPVGLEFTLAVSDGGAATGTLNVVLSHYDDAPKDGTTRSDESDVDITFQVTITG